MIIVVERQQNKVIIGNFELKGTAYKTPKLEISNGMLYLKYFNVNKDNYCYFCMCDLCRTCNKKYSVPLEKLQEHSPLSTDHSDTCIAHLICSEVFSNFSACFRVNS